MNRQVINNVIQGKPIKDGTWNINEPKSQRSLQLNKYYWGVVIKIFAGELGWSDNDAHDFFKDKYLFDTKELEKNSIYPRGRIVRTIKSTTELNNAEFIDYCKKIQQFSAKQGIYIPDPNEADYDLIYKIYKRD